MMEDEDDDNRNTTQITNDQQETNTLFIEIDSIFAQVNVGKDNPVNIFIQQEGLQREADIQNRERVEADGEAQDVHARRYFHASHSPVVQKSKNTHCFPHDASEESDESDQQERRKLGTGKRRVKPHSEHKTVEKVNKNLGPATPSDANLVFFKMSDTIMMQLQTPRDMGQWKVFDELAVTLSHNYHGSHDVQVMILMERGQAACYNNRLEDSKKMLKEARNMAYDSPSPNSSLLIGRQRTVSEKSILDAKKCLNEIKERYWDETTRGEKIQYFLTQSDLHFRMKLYKEAEEYVLKALAIAEEFGFNTEIQPANERLEKIRLSWDLAEAGGNHGDTASDVFKYGDHNNAVYDVCADGDYEATVYDVCADGDHCDTVSDICSNTEPDVSEGHIGDISSTSESDCLKYPSYIS